MKFRSHYKLILVIGGLAVLVCAALLAARVIEYSSSDSGIGDLDTALRTAVRENDLTVLRVLLWLGVGPEPVNPGRVETPLLFAAYEGNLEATQILLRHGANPDGADKIFDPFAQPSDSDVYRPRPKDSMSVLDRPLFWAARRGHHEIAALLRERGAQYQFIDALFLADEAFVHNTLAQRPRLVEELANYRSEFLRYAIEANNVPAAKLMLELGFDPDAMIDYARRKGRTELVALFRAYRPPVDSAAERLTADPIE